MKILSFNAYYTPEFAASLFLEEDIAEGFANACLDNEMYVPTPSRGVSNEVREAYKSKKEELFFGDRLRVVRYDLMKEGKNPILRALRYFLQNFKQYRCGTRAKDIDVVFCGSTPPTQGLMAGYVKKKLCKKYKKYIPFVYNLQDVFPDSLVGTGLAKKGGLLWKIGRKIEDKTYQRADKIIVISQDFKRNLLEKGVLEDKIEVVYNWVDTDKIAPVKREDNPLYEEFDISRDSFNVVYAGNLGNAQNVMLLVEAAKELKNNSFIRFIIFGSGGIEQELKNEIESNNLDNMKILPLQPFDKVPFVYSLGDVCVVACKAGLGGSAMPSKTWSIMACESAVLANFDEGELMNIVEDNGCGKFTKAGDIKSFVNAIISLSQNPEECKRMGEKGRLFVMSNLNKDICTKKYAEIVKSVVNK